MDESTDQDVAVGPWRRRTRRTAYANPWLRIFHDEVTRPDGEPGIYGVVHFENLAVGIVAVDADDRVLLVGQHRYTLDEYSWELPEGGSPLAEDPLEGARRELEEETGFRAAEWRELCRCHLSNSVTDELAVVYLATGLSAGTARPEGTEALEVRWLALEEALAMAERGELTDAMTLLGLWRLALDRVRGASPAGSGLPSGEP